MLGREVYVLGVGMSRFGKPGLSLGDRIFEAGVEALEDADIEFNEIGSVYLGSVLAPPTTGVRAIKDLGLTGVPVQRIENASATGGATFHEAVHAVASGRVETALALGFDDPGMTSFNDWQTGLVPLTEAVVVPALFFAFWAVRRMHERGTTAETLAAIAAKNWNHAALNPKAERQPDSPVTVEQVMNSRMVAYPHTARMAAPMGAGAAAAILGSKEALAKVACDTNRRRAVRVAAAQAHSERFVEGHLFAGAIVGPPEMARRASFAAYEEAGLGPEDLDTAQVHDAYAIEELLYYEEIGLCPEGDGDRLVHDGETALGGRIPVSTDGGFIGRGHPAGPTGLAQIWELTHQVRGTAGARQVDGAKVGLAHIVGAGSVCFAHILIDGS